MFQFSEDLTLEAEPLANRRRVGPRRGDLQRNRLPVLVVVAHGFEDQAHAAAADFANDAIGPATSVGPAGRREIARDGFDRRRDARAAVGIVPEHPGELTGEGRVAGGFARGEVVALAGRQFHRGEEQGLEASPALVGQWNHTTPRDKRDPVPNISGRRP